MESVSPPAKYTMGVAREPIVVTLRQSKNKVRMLQHLPFNQMPLSGLCCRPNSHFLLFLTVMIISIWGRLEFGKPAQSSKGEGWFGK